MTIGDNHTYLCIPAVYVHTFFSSTCSQPISLYALLLADKKDAAPIHSDLFSFILPMF
jgi:hypothetical protein